MEYSYIRNKTTHPFDIAKGCNFYTKQNKSKFDALRVRLINLMDVLSNKKYLIFHKV